MRLLMYSKALYSSWLFYSPDRLLFDAGEGASSVLGNKAFAVERVFVSHGHADHVAGLVGLVNIRNNAMGDKEKGLTIYYPKDNVLVLEMMAFLARTNRRLSYALEWIPLVPGQRVPLSGGSAPRFIEPFPTVHVHNEKSLGYNIIESRHRLKPELSGLAQSEIVARVRAEGRDAISEVYEQKLFSFGGDSVPLKAAYVADTEVLCHDATFLDEEDRKEYKHATLAEALRVAQDAGVKRELLCFHISSRYKAKVKELAESRSAFADQPFRVTLVPPGRVFVVD